MPSRKKKAPGFVKGIQPLTLEEMLKNASPDHVQALMHDNLALWAQFSGIKVDGHVFNFDKHRYLLPIYLDPGPEIVWRKAAQLGATIYMLLRLLWWTRYRTCKAALYFPTGEGVEVLSKDRLTPLIASNPELQSHMTDTNTLGLKQVNNTEGNISSLYMLYVGGKASKDSVPLDVIGFDEVRLIDQRDIDQCLERISHSSIKQKMFMSTSGMPGCDIDARFQRGTQLRWHARCNCTDGVILADTFPDCIVERKGEVYLRCPKCKYRIHDPQNGRYIAHNPGADFNSYAVSQLVSKYITPKEIWEFYQTTTHIQEFHNAKLGLPYVDHENRPVNADVYNSCINQDLKWAYQQGAGRARKSNCAMGVDQHSGNCYVTIMKRGRDGKKELVHLEVIESYNPDYWEEDEITGELRPVTPFNRVHQLMKEFNVGMCVIDAMPNANEAQELARSFPGKVFIAWYKDAGQDMVLWTDRDKLKEGIRKGSTQLRLKWQVLLQRYVSMDFLLRQFVEGIIQVPPPRQLKMKMRSEETGRFEFQQISDRFKEHLGRLVRQVTVLGEENEGRRKYSWIYMGGDPHFAHSANYCNIAMERLRHRAMFTMA